MNIISKIIVALIFMLLSLAPILAPIAIGANLEAVKQVGVESDSALISLFSNALSERNHIAMREIIARNRKIVRAEAERTLDKALTPGISEENRKALFYILERIATEYKMVTGDNSELLYVKKRIFESKLSPVKDEKQSGVLHVIKNIVAGTSQKSLSPNNIIINSGETVRWTNNNTNTARLASVMSTGGKKEILSPKIAPGGSWEHTFYTPGEYYYISFPNNVLYGKVIVAN